MYSIIDIETTGGNCTTGKITEIAIYKHDGYEITNEFSSLINPETPIPIFIQQFTGITDSMVKDAPKFYEIAKKIVELTQNTIFVAHNVGFDYSFVKQEFKNLGYNYQRNKLCTVRLSRKLLPGHKSYSLGKLTTDLQINMTHRHRAAADAAATVRLFEILLKKSASKSLFAY